MHQKRVQIVGNVIGIGFRAWTRFIARKLGVKGWVHNIYDEPETYGAQGGVEAYLQAEDAHILDQMIKKLHRGPPLARVKKVLVHEESSPPEVYESFTILK